MKFGLGYRSGDSFVFMAGADIGNVTFGYSYDHLISGLSEFGFAVHEFTLNFKFKCKE